MKFNLSSLFPNTWVPTLGVPFASHGTPNLLNRSLHSLVTLLERIIETT